MYLFPLKHNVFLGLAKKIGKNLVVFYNHKNEFMKKSKKTCKVLVQASGKIDIIKR